jgi:hypothetical protein
MFRNVLILVVSIVLGSLLCLQFVPTKELWPTQSINESLYLELEQFLMLRIAMGMLIWGTCLYIFFERVGLHLDVATRDGRIKHIVLIGWERFTPFTVWCWSLLGIYHFLVTLAGTALLLQQRNQHKGTLVEMLVVTTSHPMFIRLTTVCFQVSFSMAFLVSSIVTYVLIPGCKNQGIPVELFYQPLPLLFHNANVAVVVVEGLLNKIHFVPAHFLFVVLFGTAYVVFSWWWFEFKGVFYYFFLDYENKRAVLLHLGLISCVAIFFFVGLGINTLKEGGGLLGKAAIVVLSLAVMKVRRPTT